MKIELNCDACGSNRFSFYDGITDQSVVVCEDCGHGIGTMTELKRIVAEDVLKQRVLKSPGQRGS